MNLLNWDKSLKVNGQIFANSDEAKRAFADFTGEIEVHLNFKQEQKVDTAESKEQDDWVKVFRIEVRQYMTKEGSPSFDFMQKWNDNNPMPLRRMYGVILEETKGMYKMQLIGRAERESSHCCRCLRTLTHPVSMYYGIGPECGGHHHVASPEVMEQLNDKEKMFEEADKNLRQTKWTGWIIKKAITSMTEVSQVKKKSVRGFQVTA